MSDNPISLDAQLIARLRQFLQSTNVSQRQLCRMVGADPGNFSAFLSGVKSLSVTKMHKLLQVLNLDRSQLEKKFSSKALMSEVLNLQESGKPMTLDDGGNWTPGQQGTDPNDSSDDEQRLLDEIAGLHQQIIDKINAYQVKAKVNRTGSTEAPRVVNDPRNSGTAARYVQGRSGKVPKIFYGIARKGYRGTRITKSYRGRALGDDCNL
jgi:transcriptional regulator with XRE-family HTH domain